MLHRRKPASAIELSSNVQDAKTSSNIATTTQPQEGGLPARTLIFHITTCFKPTTTITTASSRDSTPKYVLTYHLIRKPDIKLHLDSTTGPIAAVSHTHFWTRTYHIGISNVSDPNSDVKPMEWIDYKSEKILPCLPTFLYQGEEYVLQRAFKDNEGKKLDKARWKCYFAVTTKKGTRVALYSPCKGKKRTGELWLREGVGDELERIIVLGVSSWLEQNRRAG